MSKRKFTWDFWNYDCEGDAYIIAKDQCQNKELIPEYICKHDFLPSTCMDGIKNSIKEGWAKYQIRRDWDNCDGRSEGGYFVTEHKSDTFTLGKRLGGWFPVWIVRKGEWY